MPVKLVIFDFDGTLADTRDRIVSVMQHVMSELRLPVADAATCASVIGLPLKDCFRTIFPTLTDSGAERCAEAYRRYLFAHSKDLVPDMFPNVPETLDALKQRDIAMAIASSRTSKSLTGFVHDMHLDEYIGMVVGCEDVAATKPSPDAVLHILDHYGVQPADAVVVGDMPVDIRMGLAAGTFTVGVTYGNSTADLLLAAGANRLIDNIADLLTTL